MVTADYNLDFELSSFIITHNYFSVISCCNAETCKHLPTEIETYAIPFIGPIRSYINHYQIKLLLNVLSSRARPDLSKKLFFIVK